MNYDFENFKCSADVKEMSVGAFKALMKKRYNWPAKKASALHKHINGNDSAINEEVPGPEQSSPVESDVIDGTEEV